MFINIWIIPKIQNIYKKEIHLTTNKTVNRMSWKTGLNPSKKNQIHLKTYETVKLNELRKLKQVLPEKFQKKIMIDKTVQPIHTLWQMANLVTGVTSKTA